MYNKLGLLKLSFITFIILTGCNSNDNNSEKSAVQISAPDSLFIIADSLAFKALYDSSNQVLRLAFDHFNSKKDYASAIKSLNDIAANFRMMGLYDSALSNISYAISMAESYLDSTHLNVAQSYFLLGVLKMDFREFDSSFIYFNKSLYLRKKKLEPSDKLISEIYNNFGTLHWYKGELPKALEFYKKALDLRLFENPRSIPVSYLYNNLGLCYTNMEMHDKALAYYDSSLMIKKSVYGYTHPQVAIGLLNKTIAYYELGLIDSSLANIKEAIRIFNIVNNNRPHPYTAQAYNNLGVLCLSIEDFQSAVEYFQKSIWMKKEMKAELSADFAQNYANLAFAYDGMNRYELSRDAFLKASELQKKIFSENSNEISLMYLWLSTVSVKTNKSEEAYKYATKALEIRKKIYSPNSNYLAIAYYGVAEALFLKKLYDESIRYALLAIEIMEKNKYNIFFYFEKTNIMLAKNYMKKKNFNEAINYCNITIEHYKKLYNNISDEELYNKPGINNSIVDVLALRGEAYYQHFLKTDIKKYLDQANKDYQLSVKLMEKVRQGILTESSRLLFGYTTAEIFQKAIEAAAEAYFISKDNDDFLLALNLSEKSRSLTLLEKLNEMKRFNFTGIPDSMFKKEKSIRTAIQFYSRLIVESEDSEASDSIKTVKNYSRLFDKRRELEKLIDDMKMKYPGYGFLYKSHWLTLEEIRNNIIDENQTAIEYFLTEDWIFIFIISESNYELLKLKKPSNFEESVQTLLNGIKSNDKDKFLKNSYFVCKVIFAPIQKHILGERCLIINDGILGYVPFDILLEKKVDDMKSYKDLPYLINKYSFGYAFSLNILIESVKGNNIINDFLGIAPHTVSR